MTSTAVADPEVPRCPTHPGAALSADRTEAGNVWRCTVCNADVGEIDDQLPDA